VSDTAVFPGEAEVLRGVTVLYHETTFLNEHEDKAAARFHSTTRQAAQVAADAGVSKLLIGHYSSRNTDQCLYEAECREVFPESYAAADGDVFEI
jgi:ribonuclease Z